jgi:predicted RNase H-like HicB family nuclease
MAGVCPRVAGRDGLGVTEEEAIRKAKAVALQILADMIENGEEVPASMNLL